MSRDICAKVPKATPLDLSYKASKIAFNPPKVVSENLSLSFNEFLMRTISSAITLLRSGCSKSSEYNVPMDSKISLNDWKFRLTESESVGSSIKWCRPIDIIAASDFILASTLTVMALSRPARLTNAGAGLSLRSVNIAKSSKLSPPEKYLRTTTVWVAGSYSSLILLETPFLNASRYWL